MSIPRFFAIMISYLLLLVFFAFFFLLFVPLISDQITVIQQLEFDRVVLKMNEPLQNLETFMIEKLKLNVEPDFLRKEINENIITYFKDVKIALVLNYLIQFAGTISIYLISISFISFFLLYEKGLLKKTFLEFAPNAYFEVVVTTIYKIEKLLSNYLIGLLLQSLSVFALVGVGLSVFGIKYALTLAAFTAVMNLIPYLGPFLSLLFTLVISFSIGGFDLEGNALGFLIIRILIVFGITKIIDDLFLQPFIFSKSVKAHPLEIFIIVFVGAALAGALGMLVAIPVYTIIRVSMMELYRSYRQYKVFRLN